MKTNWNYPTVVWVGENRIKDLSQACENLNIHKPLLVTDKDLINLPVIKNIEKISSYDAYIITALEDAQNLYSLIVDEIDSNLVFTPSILGINSK